MVTKVLNASANTARIKTWEKKTVDTYADSIKTARDMGQARLNYSRLNMVTTLSKNETEDWFSFTTTSRGKLRLTAVNLSEASKKNGKDPQKTTADDELQEAVSNYEKAIEQFRGQNLRVEVYQKINNRQVLVATNEEGKRDKSEAFEQLMRGEFMNKKAGTYYVHVTTKDGKPVKEDTLYALQVQMGDKYKHDYLTQEQSIDHTKITKRDIAYAKAQEALGSNMVNGRVTAMQGAANILAVGYTNLATMQASKNDTPATRILSLLV